MTNFSNSVAFKYWRLRGPPFLAPPAAFDTWDALSNAIFLKLSQRWRRQQIAFCDRARDPIGCLLGNLEIRLPGIHAVVRARSASNAGYGNWQVTISDDRRSRVVHMEPLNARAVLQDPERQLRAFRGRLLSRFTRR